MEQSLQDFSIRTTMRFLKPSMQNGLDNVYALRPLPTSLKCSNKHDISAHIQTFINLKDPNLIYTMNGIINTLEVSNMGIIIQMT